MTEFLATIRFLTIEEGGREGPVVSGYYPTLYFGLDHEEGWQILSMGRLTLDRGAELPPGLEADVRIKVLHDEVLQLFLQTGAMFESYEGPNLVARGTTFEVMST